MYPGNSMENSPPEGLRIDNVVSGNENSAGFQPSAPLTTASLKPERYAYNPRRVTMPEGTMVEGTMVEITRDPPIGCHWVAADPASAAHPLKSKGKSAVSSKPGTSKSPAPTEPTTFGSDNSFHDEHDPLDNGFARGENPLDVDYAEGGVKARRRMVSPCAVLSVVGFFILIVLVIVLVATLPHKDTAADGDEYDASDPSEPIPMEEYVLNLLPDYSVANIGFQDGVLTPQALAYLWVLHDPFLWTYADWRIVQRFALGTFFYATGGNRTWSDETNWLSYYHHENEWHWSISLGRNNYHYFPFDHPEFMRESHREEITHLWLFENSLSGTIPPEIGLLTNLKSVDLGANALVGSIPTQIGNLNQLFGLLLNENQLSGSVPTEFGQLDSLFWLTAFQNRLEGTIPSELGELGLWVLQLDENKLTGSLPSELGQLSDILWLRIHSNALTGSIPSQLGLMTSIQMLELSKNRLTGSLPSELGSFQMANLDMEYYFGMLEISIVLDLRFVRDFNSAAEQVVMKRNRNSLQLHSNALTGTIPSDLARLTFNGLKNCGSYLTGDEPICNGIDFHNNLLTGPLPPLSESLEYFDVSRNRLNGKISSNLGVGALEVIDASHNTLTGSIPSEIREWRNLRVFNADFNQITGPIPADSIFPLASDGSAFFDFQVSGNSMMTGTVPLELCALANASIGFTCSELLCGCGCKCREEGG